MNSIIKVVLSSMLSLLCMTTAMAQEQDPWVGTWTSESYRAMDYDSEDHSYTDYCYIIKITKKGDNYLVRAKTVKVSDPNRAIYHDAYGFTQTVKQSEGNCMMLESHRENIPFYVNGQLDSYSNTISYFKLTLENGVIHYSFYKYVVENYNKNKKYEYSTTFGLHDKYKGPCVERDLFNDNW